MTAFAILIEIVLPALIARFGLSSLRITANRIATVDGGNLHMLFDANDAPREVEPMITVLNKMLLRLKNEFERERQFFANVAHELRTPLAGLKSTIEVATARKRFADEYEETLAKCLAICDQTETLVENLFMLARFDAGEYALDNRQIDLTHLIRESWKLFAERAEQRGLTTSWELDESMQLTVDSDKLSLILRNLFENAVSCTKSGTIEIRCNKVSNRDALIQIVNTVSNLKSTDMCHLFDRFRRAEKSRSQTGKHSGLGLPLCRSLIQCLGGNIEAKLNRDNQITVNVTLPCLPDPA